MDFFSYLALDLKNTPYFVMVFLRIMTLFFFLPIIGDSVVPTRLRILLALGMTMVIWPQASPSFIEKSHIAHWDMSVMFLLTLREVFIGFCMGFAAKFIFYAASIMSQLVGVNMGFQAASMFNPTLGEQASSFSTFTNWIIVVALILLNFHHVLILNIGKSFYTMPLSFSLMNQQIAGHMVHLVHDAFVLGLKMAAPLLCVQILVTISLGLVNRAIPQLNVLVMNFPLSFLISMTVFMISIGTLIVVIANQGFHSEVGWLESTRRILSKG